MSQQTDYPLQAQPEGGAPGLLFDEGRQFQRLVEGVTDYAIYLLDATGHIASWNPGGERIKGYLADEVMGRHFSMFYTPEDATDGEPVRALQTAIREGKYEKEGWRLRKDGTRFWASVVIDPIFDDGNLVGFAKVTRDITERRLAQEALEEAQRAFMQSQKAEAIGQLTYGLAHDFNNLLTVINNSLDRIVASNGDVTKIGQSAAVAQRASDHGALLTKQLLAFSRGQLIRAKPQDINALILASETLLRRACDAPIAIRFDLESVLPRVAIDASQFEAAVLNLVINARDALPKGGRIVISTRLVTPDNGEERVCLSVRDDGEGMTPEVLTKAFDPFFTTKEVGKGSGLGLSQVYGVVTQSDGTVTIKSSPGEGTTVTMMLPAVEKCETTKGDTRRTKVLMVDDDRNILDTVVDALRDLDYSVVTAENGKEAMERLTNDAEIDILFSDVVMPGGVSGIELARQAHALRPELKILLASGYSESWLEDMPDHCEFLPKPYRLDDLKKKLLKQPVARNDSSD